MGESKRILIVDDHPLVREGLAGRIATQSDMAVCGEAADVASALAQLSTTKPDLMIVDLALKGGHGLNLIKAVRTRNRHIKILVVSAYEESLFAERALRAGAQGYINKQELPEKVIEAIRAVLSGQHYVSAALMSRLAAQAIGTGTNKPGGVPNLSDRELEVFHLIGQGKNTRAIAEQLHVSVHTIESHREKIRAKMHSKNGTELVQRAVQWVLENG